MSVADTTTYRVETLYTVKDDASGGMHKIADAAHGATSATSLLAGGLAAVGLSLGIHEASHALIGFNREVQDAKIGLSAMIEAGYGSTWAQATAGADKLYGQYQRFSQLLPVTTQELVEFGNGVTLATIQAGGGMADIAKVTEQGTVAAKALGAESKYAALELTEMLQGNVSKRMRFANQLLGMAHKSEEEFKKMTAGERLSTVENVLGSDAMKNATDAFSTSFSGVVSTLEDRFQIFFGKVGLPLFQAITHEVGSWNVWLEKNSDKMDQFAKSAGSTLVEGFKTIRGAFEFMYNHADTLIMIGKVYAAIKIGSAVGGWAQNMATSAASMAAGGGKGVGMSSIGPAGAAAAAGYEIGTLINEKYGLSDSIAGVVKVNNEYLDVTDKITAQYANTAIQIKKLDEASESAARALAKLDPEKDGAKATMSSQNLAQSAAMYHQKANEMSDVLSGRSDSKSYDLDMNMFHQAEKALSTSQFAGAYNQGLPKDSKGNIDMDPTGEMGARSVADVLERYAKLLDYTNVAAKTTVDELIDSAMKDMTKEQRDMVDKAKLTNELMSQAVALLGQNKNLTGEDVKKAIGSEDNKTPFRTQAKNNYNVTNHIQVEVSAKDPDRWMSELDAKVAKKVRAPTQAKGTIYTRGGM